MTTTAPSSASSKGKMSTGTKWIIGIVVALVVIAVVVAVVVLEVPSSSSSSPNTQNPQPNLQNNTPGTSSSPSFPVGSYVQFSYTLPSNGGNYWPGVGCTSPGSSIIVLVCSVCAVNSDGTVNLQTVGLTNPASGLSWTNNTWTDSYRLWTYMNGLCGGIGTYLSGSGLSLTSVPTSGLTASALPTGATPTPPVLPWPSNVAIPSNVPSSFYLS